MALDPQQQIVTITAPTANDGVRALLGHLDRGPGASIVSLSFDTATYRNSGTTVVTSSGVVLVAVVAHTAPVPPGTVPPHIQIDV
ncbi:hypothetical protein [Agrococcus jejuensis]|uniref:Uncharacterized protein n=1 Tax=Agrococcus jejuensis TaxID=399736 RepID=A0A1G8C8W6_9MICO|nr:hypothetical protein [Agrococcus jejuensis]SDH41835.1 hypothetical protein SAMN04489720_1203 [Agrococcus jejuensis]